MSRGIALLFPGPWHARWWWGVNPMPRPPLPPGKTRYALYRKLGGSQGRSGRTENPHRRSIPDRPGHSSVAIPTELPGPPCSCICVYINVVANSAVLDKLTPRFCNLILKIKYKLFISSVQPVPPPPPPPSPP